MISRRFGKPGVPKPRCWVQALEATIDVALFPPCFTNLTWKGTVVPGTGLRVQGLYVLG